MTITGFLLLILVGAICGGIAQAIVGWSRGGFFTAAVVGGLGALIGNWVAPRLHLPSYLTVQVGGYTIEVLWAILGAVILLVVLSFFRRGSFNRWRHAH
jgi:uncharacterized membrane protein YeaQ/YmgE (transglycosylase-associated protein family)